MKDERLTIRINSDLKSAATALAASQSRTIGNLIEYLLKRELSHKPSLAGRQATEDNMIKFNDISYDLLVSLSEKTFEGDYLPTTFWTSDGYMISYDISVCKQDPSTTTKTIVFSWNLGTDHGVKGVSKA